MHRVIPDKVQRAFELFYWTMVEEMTQMEDTPPPTDKDVMITTQQIIEEFGQFGLGCRASITKFARKNQVHRVHGKPNRYSRNDIQKAIDGRSEVD